jgi:tetratricopeptide (TPR) repeat protein
MRWRLPGLTIGALCLSWLLAAGVARGGEAEDPEKLIQQAVELRRKGDNARAYGYLKRAFDLARTPRSAAQLGLVEHALGRYAEAEVHLGEALATSDPWVAENRSRLESSRAFVRSNLGRVEVVGAPDDATVSVGSDPSVKI